MTVRRIMGSETEFGVLAQGQPDANATVLSTRVVTGYASWVARRRSGTARAGAATRGAGPGGVVGTGWDYGSETPLADARGFTVAREDAHPSQLTDEAPELTAEQIAAEAISESAPYTEDMDWRRVVMNTVIPNGARVYVDHSHPEYSSPEVTDARQAVVWDKAGAISLRLHNPKSSTARGALDPYPALFRGTSKGKIMDGFPWDRLQFLPQDFGKPQAHGAAQADATKLRPSGPVKQPSERKT